jgi:hypothetical protein
MAKRDEPKSNIGELTDAQVYDAIRHIEQDLRSGNESQPFEKAGGF